MRECPSRKQVRANDLLVHTHGDIDPQTLLPPRKVYQHKRDRRVPRVCLSMKSIFDFLTADYADYADYLENLCNLRIDWIAFAIYLITSSESV